jgi:hypothetical protein
MSALQWRTAVYPQIKETLFYATVPNWSDDDRWARTSGRVHRHRQQADRRLECSGVNLVDHVVDGADVYGAYVNGTNFDGARVNGSVYGARFDQPG